MRALKEILLFTDWFFYFRARIYSDRNFLVSVRESPWSLRPNGINDYERS